MGIPSRAHLDQHSPGRQILIKPLLPEADGAAKARIALFQHHMKLQSQGKIFLPFCRIAKEKAKEKERLAKEKIKEQERIAKEKAKEKERLAREKAKAKAKEQERLAREKAKAKEKALKEKKASKNAE